MTDTLGPTVIITAFTLVSVSTLVVATRLYCRYFLVGAVKTYDYLMLLALFLTWGIATLNYYQVKFGTGRHMNDQPQFTDPAAATHFLEGTLKSWYVYQLVYLCDLCAVKFSILSFYRIISSNRAYRIVVYATMAVVAAFTIAMVLVNAFECPKPSDAWSTEILFQGSGSCRDLHPIYYSQAGFNIASDVVILLLPMPVLRKLHMRQNKRLALIGIFSVGSFAVIASIVRIWALSMWSAAKADVPYEGAKILMWSQIEINTAIISASIPALKPLFKRTFGGTMAPEASGYLYYGQSYGLRGQGKDAYAVETSTSASRSNNMELKTSSKGCRQNDSDEQVFLSDNSSSGNDMKQFHFDTSNESTSAPHLHGIHVTRSIRMESTPNTRGGYPPVSRVPQARSKW